MMTEPVMEVVKQSELDAFEKAVLTGIFKQPSLPDWAELAFSLKGIDPQAYVDKFEKIVKPFLRDNGLVNSEALTKLVKMTYPKYAVLVPNHDFRLVDIVENVIATLGKFNFKL